LWEEYATANSSYHANRIANRWTISLANPPSIAVVNGVTSTLANGPITSPPALPIGTLRFHPHTIFLSGLNDSLKTVDKTFYLLDMFENGTQAATPLEDIYWTVMIPVTGTDGKVSETPGTRTTQFKDTFRLMGKISVAIITLDPGGKVTWTEWRQPPSIPQCTPDFVSGARGNRCTVKAKSVRLMYFPVTSSISRDICAKSPMDEPVPWSLIPTDVPIGESHESYSENHEPGQSSCCK